MATEREEKQILECLDALSKKQHLVIVDGPPRDNIVNPFRALSVVAAQHPQLSVTPLLKRVDPLNAYAYYVAHRNVLAMDPQSELYIVPERAFDGYKVGFFYLSPEQLEDVRDVGDKGHAAVCMYARVLGKFESTLDNIFTPRQWARVVDALLCYERTLTVAAPLTGFGEAPSLRLRSLMTAQQRASKLAEMKNELDATKAELENVLTERRRATESASRNELRWRRAEATRARIPATTAGSLASLSAASKFVAPIHSPTRKQYVMIGGPGKSAGAAAAAGFDEVTDGWEAFFKNAALSKMAAGTAAATGVAALKFATVATGWPAAIAGVVAIAGTGIGISTGLMAKDKKKAFTAGVDAETAATNIVRMGCASMAEMKDKMNKLPIGEFPAYAAKIANSDACKKIAARSGVEVNWWDEWKLYWIFFAAAAFIYVLYHMYKRWGGKKPDKPDDDDKKAVQQAQDIASSAVANASAPPPPPTPDAPGGGRKDEWPERTSVSTERAPPRVLRHVPERRQSVANIMRFLVPGTVLVDGKTALPQYYIVTCRANPVLAFECCSMMATKQGTSYITLQEIVADGYNVLPGALIDPLFVL